MLVRSFQESGVTTSFVPTVDAIPSPRPNLVVLLGQGPEFGDLAWLGSHRAPRADHTCSSGDSIRSRPGHVARHSRAATGSGSGARAHADPRRRLEAPRACSSPREGIRPSSGRGPITPCGPGHSSRCPCFRSADLLSPALDQGARRAWECPSDRGDERRIRRDAPRAGHCS